jgi:hypothetical protein
MQSASQESLQPQTVNHPVRKLRKADCFLGATASSYLPRTKRKVPAVVRFFVRLTSALGGIAGDELCQRSAKKALQDRDKDEAIDDSSWSSSIDLRDNAQAQSCPRNRRR